MRDFIEQYLSTSERYYRSDAGPERMRAAAVEFQAGLRELMSRTVTGTDPSGYVAATVSLGGKLSRTYISPHAVRDLSAPELGEACRAAVAAARTTAAETFQAAVGEFPERLTDLDPAELVRRRKV
ncbi:YbaB/EbfC family nucleoid-associated protein [Asanoa sp. NPDC050611]|uniref:YbaB/EbfC family nucleoid-associated protein n=1 Tax=Asanoa sp. NPDC050611 TaxID=3157098 RepID=UPI0033C5F9CC